MSANRKQLPVHAKLYYSYISWVGDLEGVNAAALVASLQAYMHWGITN